MAIFKCTLCKRRGRRHLALLQSRLRRERQDQPDVVFVNLKQALLGGVGLLE